MNNCQNCHAEINEGWTLCASCRTDYARQLHKLRGNLYLLQRMARREYRLTDPADASKAVDPGTPADLGLLDEIDTAESLLQEIYCTAGGRANTAKWQRLIPRMQAHMGDLCQSPLAGEHLDAITRLNQRLAGIVDRRPRTRRIVGHCPDCGHEITAARNEAIRRCGQCGAAVSVATVKETARRELDRYHKTLTPAGCAEWLHDEYGIDISRKQVSNLLNRGKLPSSRPIGGGYWEFSPREVLKAVRGVSTT